MNKFIKMFLCSLLIMSICLLLINTNNVFAETQTYINKNKDAEWQISSEVTKEINGMKQTEIFGKSKAQKGNGCQEFGDQHVNILEMKTDGINSKLVCWGVQSGTTGVTKASLTQIAKDYEKTHPGWIVLGGVNGDQYFMNYGTGIFSDGSWLYTPTSCYPLAIENEMRYPISPIGVYSNYRGILNNGKEDSLAKEAKGLGFRVEVIDEAGNILYYRHIDKINEKPNAGEISVWSSYVSDKKSNMYIEFDVNTENNLYIVEKPELAFMPASRYYNEALAAIHPTVNFPDVLFGRGTITKIANSHHFGGNKDKQEEHDIVNTFAIESNDKELEEKLTLNTRIRVEYYYESEELNNCESFLNYHSIQRENGVNVVSDQPYDTQRYSRSVWGRKADGTYILLTTAKYGNQYKGTSQDETNAILEKFGVVDAYQQDGGGSAMCIVRNIEKNTFDVVQPSRDGTGKGQRNVAYACLFVMRDPGIDVNKEETTYHSAELVLREDYDHSSFSNYKVTLNNQEYTFTDNKVLFDNLKPDTSYIYTVTYDVKENDKTSKGTYSGSFLTQEFPHPTGIINIEKVNKTSVVFKYNLDKVKNLVINCNDKQINCNEGTTSVEVTGLEKGTAYVYNCEFDIYNEYADETYHLSSVPAKFTTLDKLKPTIDSFVLKDAKDKSITLTLNYSDEDEVISSIYILSGNEMIEVSNPGDVEITDLTPNTEYKFKVICEYNTIGIDEKIESEELIISTTEEIKSGCGSSNAYIYLSLLAGCILLLKKKH